MIVVKYQNSSVKVSHKTEIELATDITNIKLALMLI